MSFLQKIGAGIHKLIGGGKLDDNIIEEIEELLLVADFSFTITKKVVAELKSRYCGKDIATSVTDINSIIKNVLWHHLQYLPKQISLTNSKPTILLLVGVNGSGKTTSLGKLAHYFKQQKMAFIAGDTFRAGAISQLREWGNRTGAITIDVGEGGKVPARIFSGLEQAPADADIIGIDTAGRLHNKANLIEQLSAITRVITKFHDNAPHHTIGVLDATSGQSLHNQVRVFKESAAMSGVIITKLDGLAKGGAAFSACIEHKLPIYAVSYGEKLEDFCDFNQQWFDAQFQLS